MAIRHEREWHGAGGGAHGSGRGPTVGSERKDIHHPP
jgi:hypothetical protein